MATVTCINGVTWKKKLYVRGQTIVDFDDGEAIRLARKGALEIVSGNKGGSGDPEDPAVIQAKFAADAADGKTGKTK